MSVHLKLENLSKMELLSPGELCPGYLSFIDQNGRQQIRPLATITVRPSFPQKSGEWKRTQINYAGELVTYTVMNNHPSEYGYRQPPQVDGIPVRIGSIDISNPRQVLVSGFLWGESYGNFLRGSKELGVLLAVTFSTVENEIILPDPCYTPASKPGQRSAA